MKSFRIAITTIILAVFFASLGIAGDGPSTFDYSAFRQIPVLHEGRIKPLQSFARTYLLAFCGKSSLPGLGANQWLAELLFDHKDAFERPVFNIANPDTVAAVGLSWRLPHTYSFAELSKVLDTHVDTVNGVLDIDPAARTNAQQQLLELYARVTAYAVLANSFALLQPDFRITDPAFANALHLPANKDLTLLDLIPHEEQIINALKPLQHKKAGELTASEKEHVRFAEHYFDLTKHDDSNILRIMPPQWTIDNGEWLSPTAVILGGHGSPQSAGYLDLWQKLAVDYKHQDAAAWRKDTEDARTKAYELGGAQISPFRLKLETLYLDLAPFNLALSLYLLSFVLLLAIYLKDHRWLYKSAMIATGLAAILHFMGIAARITIMNRPPVATLYETTIFVSLIAVILSLAFERRRRDGTSLMAGSLIGSILLFISMRYAADGDTMEMLVAVLNTNFWLATHVVAVTMGYGCSLLAGTLAHIYLIDNLLHPQRKEKRAQLLNAIVAVSLIAAFFATLGTILGGIWADQSWGRFWGWDPKENGAMLIVLWLLWLLHGRISNVLSPLNFATGAAFTTVIVALSWFGVNLLSVGLHSYGFTNNIAFSLGAFCGAEILTISGIRGWLRVSQK